MSVHGISTAGAFPQSGGESGAAQPAARHTEENRANAEAETVARADKYDHESAVHAVPAADSQAKGVYRVDVSHSKAEESSAGPDDFREVEVLKRKRQSLLQQLAGETNAVIRSQLQTQIQHISAQISMKDSLAAAK